MANLSPPFTLERHTAADGYVWQYRHYAPVDMPRGQIVCIHGIQSHAGWYEHSCDQWRRAGFSVYFLDRRGSGTNEQARGDAPSFRRLLDDLAEFLEKLRHQFPDQRLFLVAISWGGKLGAALQRRYPGLVDGLVLLCPGFFAKVKPSLKTRLKIAMARLVSPRKRFPIPLNDPELFTADPDRQQFIREDPLGLREASARLLVESLRLDAYLRFTPKYVHVPLLLLLAERDRIIDNARTRRFVEAFATPEKEVIEYPGVHHTLEFEPVRDQMIQDVLRWTQARLGS